MSPRTMSFVHRVRGAIAAGGERGQIFIFTALLIFPAFMIGGAAVLDAGGTVAVRRDLQSTADLASLAGVVELPDQTAASAKTLEWLDRNGFDGSDGNTALITFPTSERVRVQLTSRYDSIFAGFIGSDGWDVGARATAQIRRQPSPVSLFALGDVCPTLTNGGNSSLVIDGGASYTGGTCSEAMDTFGTMTLTGTEHYVVGGVTIGSNTTVSPAPRTGSVPREDPYAYLDPPDVPSGTCASVSVTGSNTQTITAGCYEDISTSGGSSLTLSPGVYVIKGDLSIGGTSQFTSDGAEVLIYLTCSPSPCNGATRNFSYTGSELFDLTGHSDYGNLVFWIDRTAGSSSTLTLNGNSNFDVQGGIYHVGGQVQLGGSSDTPLRMSIVSDTFRLAGGANLTIEWGEEWAPLEEFPVLVE